MGLLKGFTVEGLIMKMTNRLLAVLCILGFSLSAIAVPKNLYLVSPKSITVSGNKLELAFELSCKNEHPNEWAGNLVAVSDDEGDMTVAVGVVLSKDSCKVGPKKTFVFVYDLKEANLSTEDLKNGVNFAPIDIAK